MTPRDVLLMTLLVCIAAGHAHAACGNEASLCPGSGDCTITGSSNYVDDGCVLNFGSRNIVIDNTAKLLTQADGRSFGITAGTLTVRGTLQARSGVLTITTSGLFKTHEVSNSPSRIDVRNGGRVRVLAGGDVEILGQSVNADGGDDMPTAGAIEINGANVTISGPMHANGNGGGDGGRIEIDATGDVAISGEVSATGGGAPNGAIPGNGGTIDVDAGDELDITNNLLAWGDVGGHGGVVDLRSAGAMALDDNIDVDGTGGSGGAMGGDITIVAGSLVASGDWMATGNTGARGGRVRADTTSGSLTTMSGSSISVNGGNSAGGQGGRVRLAGATDVTVGGPISATAGGTSSIGGDVELRATEDLTVTAAVEARSTTSGASQDGAIIDLHACSVSISGNLKTRNTGGTGQVLIRYAQSFAATGVSILSDTNGGTTISCACTDTNSDGQCDSPAGCVSAPFFSSVTQTPTAVVIPESPGPCP
jgi:hypothetical protein